MKWKKLGRIFCPNNDYPWMHSHASNPIADHIVDNIYRVYFSVRDKHNKSSIAWIEIDIMNPTKILRLCEKPILTPGIVGSFDDSGCSVASIVQDGKQRLLYYIGWNLSVTVPWRNSIGLAVSKNNRGDYVKISKAPIVDRSDIDPYSLSYPFVLKNASGWHMWYGSNLEWKTTQSSKDQLNKQVSNFDGFQHHIKYATSNDGVNWQRNGSIAIDFANEQEYAFARPSVIQDNDGWKMWYSFRGKSYRIGYAESKDGKNWRRRDNLAGIDISESGWDSETIEYPFVFDHKGQRFMLYNGNDYGKTGFGLAVLDII